MTYGENGLRIRELATVIRGTAKTHLAVWDSPVCGTRVRGKKIASDTTHTNEELKALVTCEKCLAGHTSSR